MGRTWGTLGGPGEDDVEILGRPWGALGGTLGDHGRSPWRPLGPKMSSRSPPGSSRRLWSSRNHFKLSWGGQCVQTISFYSKICVLGIHDVDDVYHVYDVCGPGSAVETPLPHAPGVRMTVVELTPSNYHMYFFQSDIPDRSRAKSLGLGPFYYTNNICYYKIPKRHLLQKGHVKT